METRDRDATLNTLGNNEVSGKQRLCLSLTWECFILKSTHIQCRAGDIDLLLITQTRMENADWFIKRIAKTFNPRIFFFFFLFSARTECVTSIWFTQINIAVRIILRNNFLSRENICVVSDSASEILLFAFQRQGVIRFRKSLPDEVSPDGGKMRVLRELGYARNVVSAFLGSYMQIPEIVRYDKNDVVKLSDAIRHLRPGNPFFHTLCESTAFGENARRENCDV